MLAVLSSAGCRRGEIRQPFGTERRPPAAADAAPQPQTLTERAGTLWRARVEEDCATAFLFESTRGSEGVTQESFCEYFRNEDPFRVHSATVGEVLSEKDWGWVQLEVTTSMRRFPTATPVTTQRWERWRRVDGEWMPVPAKELDEYPDSPALRDAAGEADLRARFDASWQARVNKDWPALFELVDPRDREGIDPTVFAETHSLFEYLDCNVHWVEVKDSAGVVRVTVHHKLNDPSLTKLPARDATVREEWVKYEGEWYLDVKRAG